MIRSLANIIFPKSLEIGSDFPLDFSIFNSEKSGYYEDYTVLSSGRSCISLAIKNTSSPYLLPNYLCESIINQFYDSEYDFYDVDDRLCINIDKLAEQLKNGNYQTLYLIDYFGIVDKHIDIILDLCNNYDIQIIEDFTHKPFDLNDLYGDIKLCSIRKTLAIPYGGIISGIQGPFDESFLSYHILYLIKSFAMILKRISWLKCIWRPIFVYCEQWLKSLPPKAFLDILTKILLARFSYKDIKGERIKNYRYLHTHLKFLDTLEGDNMYFSYPLIFPSKQARDDARQKLIEENIYPPIHWENQKHELSRLILSIPIDQRYNEKDMGKIVKVLKSYS